MKKPVKTLSFSGIIYEIKINFISRVPHRQDQTAQESLTLPEHK